MFRTGLANYEGVQEGLGVFAEWAVGGLSAARMRLLAGRVVAVDAMLDGAEFVDVYRAWPRPRPVAQSRVRHHDARVPLGRLRQGPDLSQGLPGRDRAGRGGRFARSVLDRQDRRDHIDEIEELIQRNLVQPPLFKPEFLQREDVERRIARLRGKSSFAGILDAE